MDSFQTQTFQKDEVLFSEGRGGTSAYVLLTGEVVVKKNTKDGEIELARMGQNEMCGEMALVSDGPRTATVIATRETRVLRLERDQFARRRAEQDPVMKAVFDVIVSRFRSTMTTLGGETAYGGEANALLSGKAMRAAVSQLRFEAEIRRGIEKQEFELYYQPIVCLSTGSLAGFEGLMRWNHPKDGQVSPARFIPAAENCNQIRGLTRIAIDQVCSDIPEFLLKALSNIENVKPLFLTLNVSGRDLEDKRFYDHVLKRFSQYQLSPGSLKLEVTETSLMTDMKRSSKYLSKLREIGVDIAIDDFGTGYSSMAYLAKLPISTLKIDRGFIMEMARDEQTRKITNGILRLAEELGMCVVAEGIEEAQDAAYLAARNCGFGQGYHFSRPVPRQQALELVANWQPVSFLQDKPDLYRKVGAA